MAESEDESAVSSGNEEADDESGCELEIVSERVEPSTDNPWMSSGKTKIVTLASRGATTRSTTKTTQAVTLKKNETPVEESDEEEEEEDGEDGDQTIVQDESDDSDGSDEETGFGFDEPKWESNEEKDRDDVTPKATPRPSRAVPADQREEKPSDTQAEILKLQIDTSKVLSIDDDGDGLLAGRDSSKSQRMAIAEAFASDDVVAEFAAAKAQDMEETGPKVVDMTLPGWGAWAGEGVRPPRRPRPRIIKHTGSTAPRADQKLPHVIISNKPSKKLAGHQVCQLIVTSTDVVSGVLWFKKLAGHQVCQLIVTLPEVVSGMMWFGQFETST